MKNSKTEELKQLITKITKAHRKQEELLNKLLIQAKLKEQYPDKNITSYTYYSIGHDHYVCFYSGEDKVLTLPYKQAKLKGIIK